MKNQTSESVKLNELLRVNNLGTLVDRKAIEFRPRLKKVAIADVSALVAAAYTDGYIAGAECESEIYRNRQPNASWEEGSNVVCHPIVLKVTDHHAAGEPWPVPTTAQMRNGLAKVRLAQDLLAQASDLIVSPTQDADDIGWEWADRTACNFFIAHLEQVQRWLASMHDAGRCHIVGLANDASVPRRVMPDGSAEPVPALKE